MILGDIMIVITLLIISFYCINMNSENQWEAQEGFIPFNSHRYFDMIGFSFFMFEGIGTVMPIMNAADEKVHQKFPRLVMLALATLCTIYILFSMLCYYTFGAALD